MSQMRKIKMKIKQNQKRLVLLAIVGALFFINLIPSFADALNYSYEGGYVAFE
jgi:hypothetical protein